MHPAYSVIFFTTASGAGYGLLMWLGAAYLLDALPADWWFRFLAFGLALGLITAGLLSSTAHLGRPERAWRALSQWPTSWLSREGVAAIATYVPAGLFALDVIFGGVTHSSIGIWAALTALFAFATVWCTAMIYTSLPTVRAWQDALVLPAYLLLAIATGGILYCGLLSLISHVPIGAAWAALFAIVAAWALKVAYWSRLDGRKATRTTADALGLAHLGPVRPLEPAHTQANFVMREMGFAVARRHAEKLRLYAAVALFLVPALCLVAMLALPTGFAPLFGLVAILTAGAGVLAERWLFFAEAQHVVTLYYGAEAA